MQQQADPKETPTPAETPAPADAPATPAPADPAPVEAPTPSLEATETVTAGSDASGIGIDLADAPTAAASSTMDSAVEAFGVSPQLMFLIGVGLLAMLLWYWSTEKTRTRRIVGTLLTIIVAAASLFFYENLGIKQGIELRGGIALTIQIQAPEGREVTEQAQETAIGIIRKRLDARGTSEVVIAKQGKDRVFVQIPGVQPEELPEIKETISKVAKLNFYIVDRKQDPSGALARQVHLGQEIVPGYQALPKKLEEGEVQPARYFLVPSQEDMPGKYVTKASARYGAQGYEINVSFSGEGADIMGPLTKANLGEPMAIVLDGEVLSAPTIQAILTDGCQITGDFSREEAIDLASSLENPLENEINIINENYISPTMGEQTVKQGINAGIAGLIVTLIFIVIYYRFAGIIALVGLVINVAVIFGAMSLFKFTLTLPGIAGIILTIGIAIDASVLIYERLREEMAEGKSLPTAIKSAYDKAFSAIFDANITTLITAVILYIVASGTVKGFAVTLMIGIIASLFSALLVTRVCFNWATETGFLKKLTFMNLIPEKNIDFLSKRKLFLTGSAILVVLSLVLICSVVPLGVDLKGGSMVTLEASENFDQDNAKEALAGANLSVDPIIQTQRPINATAEYISIRVGENDAPIVQKLLAEKTSADMGTSQIETVGSQVGDEMLQTSLMALGFAMIAILLWVTLRFEFAFALGALVALFHDLIVVLGLSTIFGLEVSLITVGAILTIAGYSINDTIVVFDRVREGLRTKRGAVKDVMNYCLNATLGRTLLTSVTTLTVVITLALFGGPALRNFAMTLIIGVLVGTYSSIFIASPIVLWWARRSGTNLRREILDADQAKIVGPAGTKTGEAGA